MIKKTNPLIVVLMLVLLGACSNEDVMPEIGAEMAGRTLTFTALMPDEDDEPSTRITTVEQPDGTITLTWDEADTIDLLFVQGTTKINGSATVENIVAEGKKATFTVFIPDTINENEPFNLYGVYGGGEVSSTNSALIKLPIIEGTTLNEENTGKNIMLRFVKENLVATAAIGGVSFKHIGFVFTAKIKVTAGSVDDITGLQLVGADTENSNWAYNASENYFDMEIGTFRAEVAGSNAVSLINVKKDITNNVLTARNWFPADGALWPSLKLSVNVEDVDFVTPNGKTANTPLLGKAYYLYATWDGTDLEFSNKNTVVPFFEADNTPIIFPAGSNLTRTIAIATNDIQTWAATSSNSNWLTVAPASGKGSGNITITAKNNADSSVRRKATITLTPADGKGLAPIEINVTQNASAPYITVVQDSLNFVSTGGVESLSVESNAHWSTKITIVEGGANWLSIIPTEGNIGETNTTIDVTVIALANTTFAARKAIITITNGAGISIDVIVTQAALIPFINIDPPELTLGKEAVTDVTVTITANVNWAATVNAEATWLTVSSKSGSSDGAILVSAEENSGTEERSAIITIRPDATSGLSAVEYSVIQAGVVDDGF